MIKKSLELAVATLLSFVPLSGAEATLITWAYSGVVTSEGGTIFSLGQVVTGTFTFETATAATGTGNQRTYTGAVLSFTIDGLASATLLSTDAGVDFNQILIREGFTAGGVILDNFSPALELTGDTKYFRLVLEARDTTVPTTDNDPACIESLALPTVPYSPLSCFNQTIQLVARDVTPAGTAADWNFILDLRSLSKVPLPGTLALLVLGVAGLSTLAWRRRR
jgi:hypothetical protein